MEITRVTSDYRDTWNAFVKAHFPPVGAFFQTWEWGEFQQKLGLEITRYRITDGPELIGVFLLVKRNFPFGFGHGYGYVPRGPVLPTAIWTDEPRLKRVFSLIIETIHRDLPGMAFIRFEPPIENVPDYFRRKPFYIPSHYVQPRFNSVVSLERDESTILQNFSAPMRHNIRKAQRRGVEAKLVSNLSADETEAFRRMRIETTERAGKTGIYPDSLYFEKLIETLPSISGSVTHDKPRSGWFVARHQGEPSAINLVIFFADTATYLFGAAFTHKLVVKVSPYLHWVSMIEAKKLGFKFYDLGGVDIKRWKTLTYFKEQFGGNTIKYMGNVDIVSKPLIYKAYHVFRALRR